MHQMCQEQAATTKQWRKIAPGFALGTQATSIFYKHQWCCRPNWLAKVFQWVRLMVGIGRVWFRCKVQFVFLCRMLSRSQFWGLKVKAAEREAIDCREVQHILRSLLLKSVGYIGLQSRTDRWSGKQVVSAKQSGDVFPKKWKFRLWKYSFKSKTLAQTLVDRE